MTVKIENKRYKFIINKKLQMKLILYSIGIQLASFATYTAASWYFFRTFHAMAVEAGLPPQHIFFQFLSKQQYFLNVIFISSAIVLNIIIFLFCLKFSHRVAGPIYNLTQHLNRIETLQDLKNVKFRKGDYFQELEDAFNNFVKKIK
jgi:hypothetical protein